MGRIIFSNENITNKNFLQEYINSAENNVLERKEANTSFGKVNKQFCYIFFQESNDVILVEFAGDISARDLMNEQGDYSDVYVVDKGFNWCYLIPHEKDDFGPYFIRKSNQYDEKD